MNPLQKTVLMILRILNPKVFADVIQIEDKEFHYRFTEYNAITGRNLRIANDAHDNTVLLWTSSTGETIACPVTKAAFMFSMIGVWKNGYIRDIDVYFYRDYTKIRTIVTEAKENKSLLKMLDRGNEWYFRWVGTPYVTLRVSAKVFLLLKNRCAYIHWAYAFIW